MNSSEHNLYTKKQSVSEHAVKMQAPVSNSIRNPYYEMKVQQVHRGMPRKGGQNPVISGYFVKEKSYKEIIISRINAGLCGILSILLFVCLVSYYFVVQSEMELRKTSKETIALNYDNSDLQNKLDNLQSFSNVDMQVSKLNMLQRAKQVIELSAADLPDVRYDVKKDDATINRYLGY